jgi:predicted ester cyclase
MSAEEIKALTHRFFEEYNKGKANAIAAMDELYATDFIMHDGTGNDIHLKDLKQSESEVFKAFPDVHFTIDDMVAEGDKVAVRFSFTGTRKGEFMGIPPTNKKVTMWAVSIYRSVGGKFVEAWERYDSLGFMQQLGFLPTTKKKE